MRRYLFSAYHFPELFQTATFEIQHLKCNVTCFPRIIFLYFFKPQRLKYNVWNATLLVFRVSFPRTFSKISLLSRLVTLTGHVTSHPVAMWVMRNGTFCTTTILRKKRRKNPGMRRTYFRDVTSDQCRFRWYHFRSWAMVRFPLKYDLNRADILLMLIY